MADPYEKISPATSAWLQSIENDGTVERALLNVLIEAESAPDLFKALGLARDFFYSPDLRLLGRAAMLLGHFDNPAAQALLEVLLNHSDARLRVVAMEAAHVSGSTWALRKTLGRLADRDERVAKRAMELYRGWSADAVRQMFESLLSAGDTTSLIDAAEGLARVAEPSLLDLVEKTFARVDISLKRKLVRGLVRLASRDTNAWVKSLIARTTDELGRGVLEAALKEMNQVAGIAEPPPPPPPAPPAPPSRDDAIPGLEAIEVPSTQGPPPRVPAFRRAESASTPVPPQGGPGATAVPPAAATAAPPAPPANPPPAPPAPPAPHVPNVTAGPAAPGLRPEVLSPTVPGAVRVPAKQPPIPPTLDPVLANPFDRAAAAQPSAPTSRVQLPESMLDVPPAPVAAPISMPAAPLPVQKAAPTPEPPPSNPGQGRILATPAELMLDPIPREPEPPGLSDSGTFTISDDMFGLEEDETLDPDETQDSGSFGVEEVNLEQLTQAPSRLTITAGPQDSGSFMRPAALRGKAGQVAPPPAVLPPPAGAKPATPVVGVQAPAQQVSTLNVPKDLMAGGAHAGVDIDASVRRKRPIAKTPQIKTTPADTERLHALLRQLVTKGGSDLHIKGGVAPYFRLNGRIGKINQPAIAPEQLLASIVSITTPAQFEYYWQKGDLDLSIGLPGAGRFRLNVNKSRGVPGMVARLIPSEIPSVDDLHLPPMVCKMTDDAQGLILVTGPTGSGKSTTLAAIVDYINSSRHGHIITVEDPVEFLHRDKLCTITQRELGTDCLTFAEGLAFANRMDPDVVMVGELRDLDTIRAAFHSAGSGRLVLATVHTNSAAKTVERIISAFPAEDQPQARVTLSLSLTAVVSQTLVPASVGGRVPAHEIMVATGGIRKAIRENNQQGIYTQIESGASNGMVTLEQSLVRLHRAGKITRRDALRWAADPALVENLL